MNYRRFHIFIFLFASSLQAFSQEFDPSFQPILKGQSFVKSIAETSDGFFLVAGSFDYLGNDESGALLKLDRQGKLAPGFNKVFTDYDIEKVKVLSSGKILIQGVFTRVNGVDVPHLARLNSNGTFDPTFVAQSPIEIGDFEIQSDERIIVSTKFYDGKKIARLNTDGTHDPTFVSPTLFLNSIFHLSIDDDDNIYLADTEQIQRLTINGTIDNTFHSGTGPASNMDGQVHKIVAVSDGKLMVGGTFTNFSGATIKGLLRLNHDGTIDKLFHGLAEYEGVSEILETKDGKILASGNFNKILAFESDGDSFQIIATSYAGLIYRLLETSSNELLLGGSFKLIQSSKQSSLALLQSQFELSTEFSPEITSAPSAGTHDIGITNDGKILLGGWDQNFHSIGNVDKRLIRINQNGVHDITFNPPLSDQSLVFGLENLPYGKILISGFLHFPDGLRYLARLNANGELDDHFNIGTGPNGIVHRIRFNGSEIFLGGNFDAFNGSPSQSFIIIDHRGNIKQTFNELPADSHISDFDLQSDGKIVVVGVFPFADGLKGMLRLNRNGTIDHTFPIPNELGNYSCITIDAEDRIYVGGSFVKKKVLFRFHSNGIVDPTFPKGELSSTNNDFGVTLLDILPTKEIVVGGKFDLYNGTNASGVIILSKDGNDFSFPTPSLSPSSSISRLKYHKGNIYIGGKLSFEDGKKVIGLGRFRLDNNHIIIPQPPAALSSNSINQDLGLSWQDKTDAEDNYEVERMDLASGEYEVITTGAANTTSIIDSTVVVSNQTNYRVRASNIKGASVYVYLKTLSSEKPAAPSGFRIKLVDANSFSLMWNDNANNEDGYLIQRSINSPDNFVNLISTQANTNNFQDTEIIQGLSYFYRVAAFNDAGFSEFTSSNSIVGTNNNVISFPNPVTSSLVVNSTALISRVQLISSMGQEILELETPIQHEVELNLSSISTGIYWLKVHTNEGSETKMIFKN